MKIKHGGKLNGKKTPEYSVWEAMRCRCNNPAAKHYADYGGRGIKICERWDSFSLFLVDMGPRPDLNHTIERRDNNKGYEPGNCYWATYKTQASNRRDNIWLVVDGERMILTNAARHLGLQPGTLMARIRSGWSIERALNYRGTYAVPQ